jgi:cellulose synthase (UDP-forming)
LGRKVDLPKLGKLAVYPPVALLYVTYNDVLPKAVNTLERQSYLNYDIFILDDSTDEICKRFLDTIGYKIIRRDNRKGYKAGALNNWLNLYGNIYKYFIISDADSIFEDDF